MLNKKHRNNITKLFVLFMVTVLLLQVNVITNTYSTQSVITAYAHSGRTDGSGGHKDNKDKSGLGSYHYHCGGYSPHLHDGGVCPYASTSSEITSTPIPTQKPNLTPTPTQKPNPTPTPTPRLSSGTTASSTKNEIKKVQKKLKEQGYDCGTADGVLGTKTKKALKAFQKDNDLTVTGKINSNTKKSLGL